MSSRHMHITTFIADTGGLREFLQAARNLKFFASVLPVTREDGRVIAVAFYSKDQDGISDEVEMDAVAAQLSGILAEDIAIISAWSGDWSEGGRERERLQRLPGRNHTR